MGIIFSTYFMCSEGVSIDHLNTVILATPKKDVEQSVGRIMRTVLETGDVRPMIIDICDDLPCISNWIRVRNSTYRKGQEVEVKNEELREFNYAQIIKVNFTGEETYDVRYSDGEIEQQVPLSRIRPYNKGYVEQTIQTPESSQSFTPLSPVSPGSQSYVPNSPEYVANSPPYNPSSPPQTQVQQQQVQQQPIQQPIQIQITTPQVSSPSILEVQPPPKEESKEESKEENANSSSSETKQINISSNSSDTTDSTKKITL